MRAEARVVEAGDRDAPGHLPAASLAFEQRADRAHSLAANNAVIRMRSTMRTSAARLRRRRAHSTRERRGARETVRVARVVVGAAAVGRLRIAVVAAPMKPIVRCRGHEVLASSRAPRRSSRSRRPCRSGRR
jgi:hypothetical protein